MEWVYPKIKDYCKEKHGLEFQVVDMRWGVRDEMTNEHATTALCMNELRGCQKFSMGPNFIYFGTQKYGYRFSLVHKILIQIIYLKFFPGQSPLKLSLRSLKDSLMSWKQ